MYKFLLMMMFIVSAVALWGCGDSGSHYTSANCLQSGDLQCIGGNAGTAGTGGNSGNAGAAGNGGNNGNGGAAGTGGNSGNAGAAGTGGNNGNGGAAGTGGNSGNAGAAGTGGNSGNGGAAGTGGNNGNGGAAGNGANCTVSSPITATFIGASQLRVVVDVGGGGGTMHVLSSVQGVQFASGTLVSVFAGDANDPSVPRTILSGGKQVPNPSWKSLSGGFSATVSGPGILKLYRFNPLDVLDVQWKWYTAAGVDWSTQSTTQGVVPNPLDPNPNMLSAVGFLETGIQAMRCAPLPGRAATCFAYQQMQPATLLQWVGDISSSSPYRTGKVDGDLHFGIYIPPPCP